MLVATHLSAPVPDGYNLTRQQLAYPSGHKSHSGTSRVCYRGSTESDLIKF